MKNDAPFIFFGTGAIAEGALNELQRHGIMPALVVTAPDKPAGRGKTLTPSPVAAWTEAHGIETLKPEKLDSDFADLLQATNNKLQASFFVVIDYGKFIPKKIIDLPEKGILNMHPSLLPRLRGPSPIRSAILQDEKETGVTVMLLDEEMDHGPIVAQKRIAVPDWPPRGRDLDALLACEGGKLLADILPHWISGELEARDQNHDVATYTNIFSKEDGLVDLRGNARESLLKIRAFDGWPGTYAFFERDGKRIRVQIIDAHMEDEALVIDRVKPEGKKEMPYPDFLRSGARLA